MTDFPEIIDLLTNFSNMLYMHVLFSAKNIFRNGRRTAVLLSGLIVGLTLLNGINYAYDTNTRIELERTLESVTIDISINPRYNTNDTAGIDAIFANIAGSEPFLEDYFITYYYYTFGDDNIITENLSSWIPDVENDRDDFVLFGGDAIKIFEEARFNGAFNLTSGNASFAGEREVLIHDSLAEIHNLSAGDVVSLGIFDMTTRYNDSSGEWNPVNITESATNLTISGTFEVIGYPYLFDLYDWESVIWGDVELALDLKRDLTENMTYYPSEVLQVDILVDHGSIDPTDTQTIYRDIKQLNNQIVSEGGITYDFQAYNYLTRALQRIESQLLLYRSIMLLLTVPILILSLFLFTTMLSQSMDSRRRELGLLRSKGYTTKDVNVLLLQEGLFLGALAGGISLVTGLFSGLIVLDLISSANVSLVSIQVTWFTVVFSIVAGIVFALIPTIRATRRFSKMNLATALEKHDTSERKNNKKVKRLATIFLLFQGALTFIVLFINPDETLNIPGLPSTIWSIIYPVFAGFTVLAPFTFTYAIAKIIAHFLLRKGNKVFTRLTKPFLKRSSFLLSTTLKQNTRRSTRLIYIIAMVLTFQIIVITVAESQQQFEYNLIYGNVGADLKVNANTLSYFPDVVNTTSSEPMPLNLSLKENIEAQFGSMVSHATEVVTVRPQQYYYFSPAIKPRQLIPSFKTFTVHLVNPMEYLNSSYITSNSFNQQDPQTMLEKISTNVNACLMDKAYAAENEYNIGDTIIVDFYNGSVEYPTAFNIRGFYNYLPGLYDPDTWSILANFDHVNEQVLGNLTGSVYNFEFRVFVQAKAGVNTYLLENNIRTNFTDEVSFIYNLAEEFEQYENPSASSFGVVSIIGLFNIETTFQLLLGLIGVAILFYMVLMEERREMCLLRVKGMSKKDIMGLQLTKGLLFLGLGIAISFIGFFLAYVINVELDLVIQGTFPRPYVVPWGNVLGSIAISLAAFVGLIIITTIWENRHTRREQIGKELRIM